jgi:hypothetical protein
MAHHHLPHRLPRPAPAGGVHDDLDRYLLDHLGEVTVTERLPHGGVAVYRGSDVAGFVHYGRGHPFEVRALDGTVLWRTDRRGRARPA